MMLHLPYYNGTKHDLEGKYENNDLPAGVSVYTHGSFCIPISFSPQHRRVPKSDSVFGIYCATLRDLSTATCVAGMSDSSESLVLNFHVKFTLVGLASSSHGILAGSLRAAPSTLIWPGRQIGATRQIQQYH